MIRLAANLGFLWPEQSLLARIDAAARAGFRAVEMHWPYEVPASEVASRLRTHDLQLLGINTAPGDLHAGERGLGALAGREREFQAAIDQAIQYCKTSGGTAIHAMAGNPASADRAAARRVFLGNLRSAAARAADQGLTLLLEPLCPQDNPGYFYSRVAQAVSLIEELGLANVRLQFDVYHVARAEGDVLTRLEACRPHLGHVQIAGVPSRNEPDEGEIDYTAVFRALQRLQYPGWVGCEYRPRGATDAGLRWMSRLQLREAAS